MESGDAVVIGRDGCVTKAELGEDNAEYIAMALILDVCGVFEGRLEDVVLREP